jgi:hypothetical protein
METVSVYGLIQRRALVTRESARMIQDVLADALKRSPGEVALDFRGVEAVTPSFVDEVLTVLAELLSGTGGAKLRVLFLNSPTRLSEKFAAVGRGHHLKMAESEQGAWTITDGVEP